MAHLKENVIAASFACVILAIAGTVLAFWSGYSEDQVEPIVSDMRITQYRVEGGLAFAAVEGVAGRRCGPPLSWSGESAGEKFQFQFGDDETSEGHFTLPDENPPGFQSFGVWKFLGVPTGNQIIVSVFHDCDATEEGQEIVHTSFSLKIPKG